MMLGARTAAWAKSEYTAKDYVQDGLIAMWDGIENAGWGVHDTNATVWKDLVGTNNITMSYGYFSDNCFISTSDRYANGVSSIYYDDLNHAESVVATDQLSDGAMYAWCQNVQHSSGLSNNCKYQIIGESRVVNGFGASKTTSSTFNGTSDVFGVGEIACVSSDYVNNRHYVFGELRALKMDVTARSNAAGSFTIGGRNYNINDQGRRGSLFCIRLYNRNLSHDEVSANYAIDKARFNLP